VSDQSETHSSNWGGDESPIVSICCTTYNHDAFIATALEGFLMQETDFPFEILIRDDCSTDNTAEIIREYFKKYPHIIKPIYEAENQFSKGVKPMPVLFKKAVGKYLALCEGDDYWTDSLKLQKQVEYLNSNEDVSIVHTEFDWLDVKTNHVTKNYYKSQNITFPMKYSKEVYFNDTFMRTMTVCFRRSDMEGYEDIRKNNWTLGDTPLYFYLSRKKNIGYLNFSTGVYRRREESVSASKDMNKQYIFWKGVMDVKFFFYDFLGFSDIKIKKKLLNQYYDGLMSNALFAKKYRLVFYSLCYKLINKRLYKRDLSVIYRFLFK